MTPEAKALHYIKRWTDEAFKAKAGESEYLQGYRAGVQAAKDVVWAIIQANIKPKKK